MGSHANGVRPRALMQSLGLSNPLDSPFWQGLGVGLATLAVAAMHWNNDGLWFQGDAPRHAANGIFLKDWLASLSMNPLAFALSYYARYPVIAPIAYPPLFYAFEALAFGLLTPSPFVAKGLVLVCAAAAGACTLMWARRWIGSMAGWAGTSVILLPGFVRYSNAVLLNIPGTAIALAALYYLHLWIDTPNARHARLFAALVVATLLTYYPAALVVPIGLVWSLAVGRRGMSWSLWLWPALVLIAAVVATAVLPVHFARHTPSLHRLLNTEYWSYYWRAVSHMAGLSWIGLAIAGLVVALLTGRRREPALLAGAIATSLVSLVALPAMSDRYTLLLGPLLVLCGFMGVVAVADVSARWRTLAGSSLVLLVLGFGARSAASTPVLIVAGVDRVAAYLREHGPSDTVLYSGHYDGVFGFYALAADPDFHRRVVLSNKLLYRYEQNERFFWIETPHVSSPADVAPLMQRKCGCQWVAVERGGEHLLTTAEHHLRRALEGPEFERIESFPVVARGISRIDLYRFRLPIEALPTVDLAFPSFSGRVFNGIQPIAGRR